MTTQIEDTSDLPEAIVTEEVEIGQGEIHFTPTNSKFKDLSIAAMINDAPNACKALIRAKVWDEVCASPNPTGKAELELMKILEVPTEHLRAVLLTVKTLLQGLNMTVPQAFHKCVLKDPINPEKSLIKRIDMNKIRKQSDIAKAKAVKIEQENKEVVTNDTVKVVGAATLDGSILTHPDGSTYTFGNRGRRPLWVKEWLTIHPEPEM